MIWDGNKKSLRAVADPLSLISIPWRLCLASTLHDFQLTPEYPDLRELPVSDETGETRST